MSGSTRQIKILADGAILEALKVVLGAEEFRGDHIGPDEMLVVYAHALTDATQHRSRLGGLKALQQVLAQPGSDPHPVEILILGFLPPDCLRSYGYLLAEGSPADYFQLPGALPSLRHQRAEPNSWRILQRRASEEELELQCSTFRHSLRAIMAAGRIYLGAAIMGHVDTDPASLLRCLQEFQMAASRLGHARLLNPEALAEACYWHQRFRADYRPLLPLQEVDLLGLDDHWTDHGWNIVYEELPFRSVRGLTRWEDLQPLLEGPADPPTVLLVDCNLGAGETIPTGLELLRSIRSRWEEVRVVFVTAYDDAALALTSLREGANVFFAKALNDQTDRRSKDYYEHFVELLRPHPLEAEIHRLWRAFRKKTSRKCPLQGKGSLPPPPESLEAMVRLAFYLLFSRIDDHLWWHDSRWSLTDDHLFRAVVNLVGAGFPELEEHLLDGHVRNVLRGGPHGGDPVTFADLRSVLDALLFALVDQEEPTPLADWARPWPEYWPYRSAAELQTDSSYPGLPLNARPLPHDAADSQGAMELIRGVCCDPKCAHSQNTVGEITAAHARVVQGGKYRDLAFIDDCGEESGWFETIKLVFPGTRVYSTVDQFLGEETTTTLAILDLFLPSAEEGEDALRRILERDPSLPVLTISAGSHCLPAIRSLRRGAYDFISKTLPGKRDLAGCFLFADEFRNKCKLLRDYGRSACRGAWQRLAELRAPLAWRSGALNDVQFRLACCHADLALQSERSPRQAPPPYPDDWGSLLYDELVLPLRLWQQRFWLENSVFAASQPGRLPYPRTYQIRPIDYWRWQHIISHEGLPDSACLARLMAVLCGVVVDRLARWHFCLERKEGLDPREWGRYWKLADWVRDLGGEFAWERRNDVLYPERKQPVWNQALCEPILNSVFAAVRCFGGKYGLENWERL